MSKLSIVKSPAGRFSDETTEQRIKQAIDLLKENPDSFVLLTRKGGMNKCESAVEQQHFAPLAKGMTLVAIQLAQAFHNEQ